MRQAWLRGAFRLVSSPALIAEVTEVLHRPTLIQRYQLDEGRCDDIVAGMDLAELAVPLTTLPIESRDPKDDRLLACALGGDVDFLVTGDQDLLVLAGEAALGRLQIVTAAAFLTLLPPATAGH